MSEIKKSNKNMIYIILIIAVVFIAVVIGLVYANSGNKVHKQLELAERYLTEMNYEQAIASFEGAIKIDPKSVEAYMGLADVYIAMADEADTDKEELYQKALDALNSGYSETEDSSILERKQEIESLIESIQAEEQLNENADEAVLEDGENKTANDELIIELIECNKINGQFITYDDIPADIQKMKAGMTLKYRKENNDVNEYNKYNICEEYEEGSYYVRKEGDLWFEVLYVGYGSSQDTNTGYHILGLFSEDYENGVVKYDSGFLYISGLTNMIYETEFGSFMERNKCETVEDIIKLINIPEEFIGNDKEYKMQSNNYGEISVQVKQDNNEDPSDRTIVINIHNWFGKSICFSLNNALDGVVFWGDYLKEE